jgi:hypothetical protein
MAEPDGVVTVPAVQWAMYVAGIKRGQAEGLLDAADNLDRAIAADLPSSAFAGLVVAFRLRAAEVMAASTALAQPRPPWLVRARAAISAMLAKCYR